MNLEEKKAQLKPVQGIYNTYVQTKADYDYLNAVYAQTENYNRDLYDVFVELEEKMPKNVQVDSMNANATTMSITMSTQTKEEAVAAILKLRSFENFAAVDVASLEEIEDTESGAIVVLFTANCTYGMNPAFMVEETAEESTEEVAE